MAFCNGVGKLLRQNVGQVPLNSMLNSFRCMSVSSTKLFIGGLSFGTDDQSLQDAFSNFGDVVEAKIITDRDTGKSRGFGFVNYASGDAASNALDAMDGKELNGRNIRISFANERPPGPRSFDGSDGFRRDRGGFGGGGGGGDGGF